MKINKGLYLPVLSRFTYIIILLFVICCQSVSQINKNAHIDLSKNESLDLSNYTLIKDYLSSCNLATLSNEFMFDYGWNCKRHGDICVMLEENVNCDGNELEFIAKNDPNNLVDCNVGGISKGYSTPFSGGMIHQSQNLFLYGYFEAVLNVPNSRGIFPAFWLFGGGGGIGYNEIDIMEYGVGDAVVHTSQEPNSTGFGTAHQKWNYSLPGQSFSNVNIRYGCRWDQNKIVWYINGRPVKITTDISGTNSNHPIADRPMAIIVNNQINKRNENTGYLPNPTETSMLMSSLKVYARINNTGNSNFTINNQKSSDISDPILIVKQTQCSDIKLNLSNSYFPKHNFFFKFVLYEACDINSPLTLLETWVKPPSNQFDCRNNVYQTENIYEFNLQNIAQLIGSCDVWDYADGNCFGITIGCLPNDCAFSNPCQHCYPDNYFINGETNFFKLIDCARKADFVINSIEPTCQGNSGTVECLNPIHIADNHGKSRIIMDVTKSITCANDYFVSIEKSNSNGDRTYNEVYKWLDNSEKELLPFIDIEKLWNDNRPTTKIESGEYYRVKFATGGGSSWKEKIQLIHILGCTPNAIFRLNGTNGDINVDLGDEIILDATESTFCSYNYNITIEDITDNNSTPLTYNFQSAEPFYFPSNITGPGHLQYKYNQGDFNLSSLINDPNGGHTGFFKCDHDYRVTLKICNYLESVCSESQHLIHMNDCVPNSTFLIHGDFCTAEYSSSSPQTFNYNVHVRMWAPNFKSCDYKAYLKIRRTTFPLSLIRPDIIITDESILNNIILAGDYDLTELFKLYWGQSATNSDYQYTVKLIAQGATQDCSGNPQSDSFQIEIRYDDDGGCGSPFSNIFTRNSYKKQKLLFSKIMAAPNPSSNGVTLTNLNGLIKDELNLELFNSKGQLISTKKFNTINNKLELSDSMFPKRGLYFIKISDNSNFIDLIKVIIEK